MLVAYPETMPYSENVMDKVCIQGQMWERRWGMSHYLGVINTLCIAFGIELHLGIWCRHQSSSLSVSIQTR